MYNINYFKRERKNILEKCYFTERQQSIFNELIKGTPPKIMPQMFDCSFRTIQNEISRIKKQVEIYRNGGDYQSFYIYIHIFPNGKKYVGVTQNTIIRWGKDGLPYCNNLKMYEDILKFGWENIKHEIIMETTSETQARRLENKLITIFELNDNKNGYNIRT